MTTYKHATVRGRKMFYRESGNKDAPTIVLLHGFPSSSHMFRDLIPKLSVRLVWGANDPFFTVEGAKAYLRDIPHAELHLIDTGHFALETHAAKIAATMEDFLAANGVGQRRADSAVSQDHSRLLQEQQA
jgi:pimeloyl-ACP methyl ester carboxylesterase